MFSVVVGDRCEVFRLAAQQQLMTEAPIGSGVMEAGCKTVVGNRLQRAGMRWSRDGGQQILNLRTTVLSRRWDHFWSAHMDVAGATKIRA